MSQIDTNVFFFSFFFVYLLYSDGGQDGCHFLTATIKYVLVKFYYLPYGEHK